MLGQRKKTHSSDVESYNGGILSWMNATDPLLRDQAIEAISSLHGVDSQNNPWRVTRRTATLIVDAILADGLVLGNAVNDPGPEES